MNKPSYKCSLKFRLVWINRVSLYSANTFIENIVFSKQMKYYCMSSTLTITLILFCINLYKKGVIISTE